MKNKIVKTLYIIIELLLIATVIIAVINNTDKTTEYFCALMQKTYTVKLIYITLAFSFIGFVIGYIFNQLLKTKMTELFNAYQKRHESTSIQKDTDKARISTLEAKIATLEAALESALKNK